jgi:hypothetical protein
VAKRGAEPSTALARVLAWLGVTGSEASARSGVDEPGIYNAIRGGDLRPDRWEKVALALEVPVYLLRANDLAPARLREELSRNALERSGLSPDYQPLSKHLQAPVTPETWRTLDEQIAMALALAEQQRFDRARR